MVRFSKFLLVFPLAGTIYINGGGCSVKVAELQVQGFKKLEGKDYDEVFEYIKKNVVIKDKKKFPESNSIFKSEDKDFKGLVFCAIVTESFMKDQGSEKRPLFAKIEGSKFYMVAFVGEEPLAVTDYDVKCDENNKKLVIVTFKDKAKIVNGIKSADESDTD